MICRRLPVVVAAALLSGCATIVGGGTSQRVTFNAAPSGATVTVKSSSGIQMAQTNAPATVRLPRKNEYQVEIAVPGYRTQTLALTQGLNGWVWGNLLIGWIPGFIVDFASGSAKKLEPSVVSVNLQTAAAEGGAPQALAVVRLQDDAGRLVRTVSLPLVPVTH